MLTKLELQEIHAILEGVVWGRPAAGHHRVADLADRVKHVVQAMRPVEEKGRLVLAWPLATDLAPTLNRFAYMKGWQKKKLCQRLDADLLERGILAGSKLNGAQRRRWVRVTRFSTRRVDEESVDVLGGKLPIDALTRAGVFVDDSQVWLKREGLCRSCKRGETSVLVEVFEVTTEGQPVAEPKHETVAAPIRELGEFTKAIAGDAA